MAFTKTARDILLLGSTLQAQLQRQDGSWCSASIDLNSVLGNIEGKFTWGKKWFSSTAKDLRLEGSVLKAQLLKSYGSWASGAFDLQDRLMNNDGVFEAVEIVDYSTRILATSTTFNLDDDGVWALADVKGDGSPDLVCIKTRNTVSSKVEVHASENESRFQDRAFSAVTAFNLEDNGTYLMQDYNGEGKADLVYIKTRNTGSKHVEVHVASADSDYQEIVSTIITCFVEEDADNGIWTLSNKGDLIYIKTKNTAGKIEIHIATLLSSYQKLTVSTQTGFALEDNGTWCMVSNNCSTYPDLYYIKTRGGVSSVEVRAVSASSNWQTCFIDVSSSFEPEENGHWLMGPLTYQEHPDLVYIKTRKTRTKRVEIHAAASKPCTPKTYVDSSRDVSLQKSTLRAQLQRNNGSWRSASIDLNTFLGNIEGKFSWGNRQFMDSAKDVCLEGSILKAQLHKSDGSWVSDDIDLRDRLMNNTGVFQAVELLVFIEIPPEEEELVMSQLDVAMNDPNFKLHVQAKGVPRGVQVMSSPIKVQALEEPDGNSILYANAEAGIDVGVPPGVLFMCSPINVQAREEPDGNTIGYANAKAGVDRVILSTASAEASASIFHMAQKKGKKIEQFSVDAGSLKVSASVGLYNGVDAQVNLIGGEVSCFDFNLGLGVGTGVGIKDDSLEGKVLGCGIQIGRKVGISVFENSVAIDFGKIFDLFS